MNVQIAASQQPEQVLTEDKQQRCEKCWAAEQTESQEHDVKSTV